MLRPAVKRCFTRDFASLSTYNGDKLCPPKSSGDTHWILITERMQADDLLKGPDARGPPIDWHGLSIVEQRLSCDVLGKLGRRVLCCPGLSAVPRGPPSWPLVSTLEFRSENGKRLCVTFTDGHAAKPIIIGVHAHTSGTTRSVQGQDNLDGGEHCWQIECLDPDLSHARTICLWFRRSLGQEDWMLHRYHGRSPRGVPKKFPQLGLLKA